MSSVPATRVNGIVPRAVHAERVDARVAGEDGVRAVALVHVEIDDRRARDAPFALQRADRDGDVVEDAESLAVVRERVVRAAGEIDREPVLERGARGGTVRRPRRGATVRRVRATRGIRCGASPPRRACRRRARRRTRRRARAAAARAWRAAGRAGARAGSALRRARAARSSAYFAMGKRCAAGSGMTYAAELHAWSVIPRVRPAVSCRACRAWP